MYKNRGGLLMAPISLTALRNNLFQIVDGVIKTGNPVVIERNGHRLKIVLEEKTSKLKNLKPHDCIVGDPDELIQLKVTEWHEEDNL
jgi:CO dehydrogenase/acetyl-CoA synthase alpha subunit